MTKINYKFYTVLNTMIEEVLSSIKKSSMSTEDTYLYILGVSKDDVNIFMQKISNAIPDSFYNREKHIERKIQEDIVKDFILFMAQEEITNKTFDNNFANFLYSSVNEINAKYNTSSTKLKH